MAACLASGAARADETGSVDTPVVVGLVAGTATQMVSLGVGAGIMALGKTDSVRAGGALLASTGLTVAPFLAHAIVGEWARGALFTLLPAAAEGVMMTIIGVRPDIVQHGELAQQYVFVASFVSSVVLSSVGVVDAALAGYRARLRVAPLANANTAGLALGGAW
jgi:hypothetical protein